MSVFSPFLSFLYHHLMHFQLLLCAAVQIYYLANSFSLVQACLSHLHVPAVLSSVDTCLISTSLSSTAVSVAVIVWLAGLAGTCGQCLCVVSGTGPLWGRLFPHCAPPWLGQSVRSCGLLECKLSVPLSNPPPPSYMAIYAFVLVLSA